MAVPGTVGHMKRVEPLSGFPEWLPEQRLVELAVLDAIRRQFELHGFVPIETPAVERLDNLLHHGETDKELYVVRRLHARSEEPEPALGLHYDLTVPLARYVLQHRGDLAFPFKRYQIQKSWRGERPQDGRYREFYQADIDVVGDGTLSLAFDSEIARIIHEVLAALPLPPVRLAINNRKLCEGFYQAIGIEDVQAVLRIVDKLDRVGEREVRQALLSEAGLSEPQADGCLQLARIHTPDTSFAQQVRDLGAESDLIQEGIDELASVLSSLSDLPTGSVWADLRVARGLDYYTGTVYETSMAGHESLGSICSGGRYDNLATGANRTFPGVGVSIGVSRVIGRLLGRGELRASRRTPTCVLVALSSEQLRGQAQQVAKRLRERGIPCEVFHEPVKFGNQIRYAARTGIPYVWFLEGEQSGSQEVRDIRSGEQRPADAATWSPRDNDLVVRVERPAASA